MIRVALKFENAYMLYFYRWKWYIVPRCEFFDKISYPNNYISFYFKTNAEKILKVMNSAWNEGYRYKYIFKGEVK